MNEIINFFKRNIAWLILGIGALWFFKPEIAEIRTILMILATESIALALSGLSAYVYTKIDFTKNIDNNNLGFIFLGVHLCVGLTILGVYIAQFGV